MSDKMQTDRPVRPNLSDNHKAGSSTSGTNELLAGIFWDLPPRTFEL